MGIFAPNLICVVNNTQCQLILLTWYEAAGKCGSVISPHRMENVQYILYFSIKSISPFSFMEAEENDLHQDFCIIFHLIQLYKSDCEGWPTYFISTFSLINVG